MINLQVTVLKARRLLNEPEVGARRMTRKWGVRGGRRTTSRTRRWFVS